MRQPGHKPGREKGGKPLTLKRTDAHITRFKCGDYFVDIIDDGVNREAWLTHKDMGVSNMMFGARKRTNHLEKDTTMNQKEFYERVEDCLALHIRNYEKDYM